jgi:hypothetical protein
MDAAAFWLVIGVEHAVPLSGPALSILAGLEREGDLIFPRRHDQALRYCLQRRMGFKQYGTHWFRAAFSTGCQKQDVPRDLREMALGHAEWR